MSTLKPKWSAPDTPPPKVVLPTGDSAPRLDGPQKSISSGIASNLKDFLTERSVKLPKDSKGFVFKQESFETSFADNLKEWFKPMPRLARGAAASRMSIDWQAPGKVFWQNIRDFISPPKLPPLKVTSQPVKVKDIWSKDEAFGPSQAIALSLHLLVLALIVLPIFGRRVPQIAAVENKVLTDLIDISPYSAKLPPGKTKAGGGGGGGDRSPLPATRGAAPKFSMTQIAPPLVRTDPNSQFQATLLGPPDLKVPSPDEDHFGDPLAKLENGSGGPGGGSGIGTGTGTGIGSGSGGGLGPGSGGGTGGGAYRAGTGGVGFPTCTYCPDPKYSEEARKAKYQGTVLLQAVITADGRAIDIQIVKGPGLGLDEKALEAVQQWRFKPALGPNGKPVSVIVPIEVTFRLL